MGAIGPVQVGKGTFVRGHGQLGRRYLPQAGSAAGPYVASDRDMGPHRSRPWLGTCAQIARTCAAATDLYSTVMGAGCRSRSARSEATTAWVSASCDSIRIRLAMTVEPAGGTSAPTSTPIVVVPLPS
jgi:hypothetical protein